MSLPRALSEAEYLATLGTPMERVPDGPPPFDFWPYFEAIPESDFRGADCSAGEIPYVWREPGGRFEHVLVSSTDPDVFMVLVLDLRASAVWGHRLMNMRREYGLERS